MNTTRIHLSDSDYRDFREWIQLNLEGLTWQGRYKAEFEKFWELFFREGITIYQLMERFSFAISESQIGPLVSWFNWLRDKFICYIFITKDLTLLELSEESGVPVDRLASILRGFFIENYPHLDEFFSDVFQVGNIASENLGLTFKGIKEKIQLPDYIPGSHADEIMPSMEVTLYDKWEVLLKKFDSEIFGAGLDLRQIKSKSLLKRQLKTVREVVVLLLVGGLLILGIQKLNRWYENYLVDKISIYEPEFNKWFDKTLTFKSSESSSDENFNLKFEDIEKVEDRMPSTEDIEEARYDVESEVVLTSWDTLPKDFDVAGLEKSEYEELAARGYRESRYGNTKVYRVMMKSVAPNISKEKLNALLDKYKVTQVDNVKPGQEVPGGIYYNLYVPRKHLKEFLAQVMETDEAILYENRTRGKRNPPGMNKVFIWIKTF